MSPGPLWWILRFIAPFEDRIVNVVRRPDTLAPAPGPAPPGEASLTPVQILRRPGFHRAVGRVHRAVNGRIHGRSPHEPLAPGEATADPRAPGRRSFLRLFVDELKNQSRGRPTDLPKDK